MLVVCCLFSLALGLDCCLIAAELCLGVFASCWLGCCICLSLLIVLLMLLLFTRYNIYLWLIVCFVVCWCGYLLLDCCGCLVWFVGDFWFVMLGVWLLMLGYLSLFHLLLFSFACVLGLMLGLRWFIFIYLFLIVLVVCYVCCCWWLLLVIMIAFRVVLYCVLCCGF